MKQFLLIFMSAALLLVPGCGKTEVKEAKKDVDVIKKSEKHYSIEQFMNTKSFRRSAFSHDEKSILFTSDQSGIFNVYQVPVEGGQAVALTESKKESTYLASAFPNDGRILVEADSGGNEIDHIFLREKDGTLKDLTPEPKAKASFHGWSHDLKSFFFTSNKRNPKFLDIYEMDSATLSAKLIFKNDEGFGEFEISADKRYIAFEKTETDHNSDIYLLDRTTVKLKNITEHKNKGDIYNTPQTFHPVSGKLYYLTNENSEFDYLNSYDPATGKMEKVLEKNWPINSVYFSHTGTYRVIGINNDGRNEVEILDTATQKPVQLTGLGTSNISFVRFSKSEKLMVFYASDAKTPRNLHIYDHGKGSISKLTDSMNPEIDKNHLAGAEVIRYKSFDGLEIPAIFYKPVNIPEGEKIPALVWVHGGPGGQSRIRYSSLFQYLLNHGYAILAVNNRGSSGYGKTFYKLDDLKHGEDDLADCVEAKKFLKSTGFVDEKKIGIIGGSYGGYMVAAALAFRPDEFTVGVNIFGVTNWLRTLKSIPAWWESFREALYKELGNPNTDEAYLKKISPLFHADKITKPMLVLQGANDPRVLKVESDEIVEAVRKKGVPVEYLVFDDEGHGFSKKKNRIESSKAILKFLDKYLKGKTESYVY
jgi:dipeptidyl aminopeptidase/acylaminoacyl peptidase